MRGARIGHVDSLPSDGFSGKYIHSKRNGRRVQVVHPVGCYFNLVDFHEP